MAGVTLNKNNKFQNECGGINYLVSVYFFAQQQAYDAI
jgi:hypothetical protein